MGLSPKSSRDGLETAFMRAVGVVMNAAMGANLGVGFENEAALGVGSVEKSDTY